MRDVGDLYSLDFQTIKLFEGFGETSVENLRLAIESSKERTLGNLIFGLSIPHVGRTNADLLAVSFGHLDKLLKASLEELKKMMSLCHILIMAITIIQDMNQVKNMRFIVEKKIL